MEKEKIIKTNLIILIENMQEEYFASENKDFDFFDELLTKNIESIGKVIDLIIKENFNEIILVHNNYCKKNAFQKKFFNNVINLYKKKDYLLFMQSLPICIEYICRKKVKNKLLINLNSTEDGFVFDTLGCELTYLNNPISPFTNELLKIILTSKNSKYGLRNKILHCNLKNEEYNLKNSNLLLFSYLIILLLF